LLHQPGISSATCAFSQLGSLASDNNWIVSVALDRGAGLDGCPGADALVVTTHAGDAPANEDHGFIIWFE
jgi:hypothetical protein